MLRSSAIILTLLLLAAAATTANAQSGTLMEPLPHSTGEWLDVRIAVLGPIIQVYVNGALVLYYDDPTPAGAGEAMLTINAGGTLTAHAQWDDFVIDAFDAVDAVQEDWSTIKGRY